ncbi:proteoglycan 4b [Centroberyx gerrardi]|uniref:proteoglycan 4b n=1 Tax=Centroberyx gerrardi TaxID=166262 RepID=UPI003AAC0EA4
MAVVSLPIALLQITGQLAATLCVVLLHVAVLGTGVRLSVEVFGCGGGEEDRDAAAHDPSCSGRCGAEYYRGYMCQCDYDCLIHDECCKDYESQCTTGDSCKGRCGETFKRGRQCNCDSDCMKYNQCCPDYKTSCDAQEPTLNAEAEQPNGTPPTFSEGDNPADADDLIPLVTPASDPQDDVSDDVYGQIFPNLPDDPYSENGMEDPDATTIPESTSGYEPSPTDLLEPVPTDPTLPDTQDTSDLEFTREESFTLSPQRQDSLSDNEPTQADANATPSDPTNGEAPTDSADASDLEKQSDPTSPSDSGTTLPRPSPTSAGASHVSRQPTPTSMPQIGPTPTDDTLDIQSGGQAEIPLEGTVAFPDDMFPEAQTVDPTEASSGQREFFPTDPGKADDPDFNQASSPAMTPASDAATDPQSTGPTRGSSSVPGRSEPSPASPGATAASSKPDQTHIPEATTPNSEPDGTKNNAQDVPTATSYSLSDPQDPSSTDFQAPGSEDGSEPDPESGARGDTPDRWNGPGSRNDALTTGATPPTETTTDQSKVSPAPSKPTPSRRPSKPQAKPKPSPAKPSLAKPTSKPTPKPLDTAQTPNIDSSRDFQADDSNDTNLCSGRPTSAVTTLGNGTMVVFRGHYFWVLNRNRVPGPARSITEVWGVPSPIDTVFTRCNCQGKTYIFKGGKYWRFENDVVDPGYPKLVQTGFDGLRGHITAALSVPQYQTRKESVYFFKRGGLVQKYSYQFGTSPTCGRKVQHAVYTVRNRLARQAVSLLEPAINLRTAWVGFPPTITSAVSVPVPRRSAPEGYKYYVFSRSKYYNVRMDAERPVVAAPQAIVSSPQRNSANDFFKCSKKV